ncbi:MAG: radical SAM protein [Ignavibacteriales bacterium]
MTAGAKVRGVRAQADAGADARIPALLYLSHRAGVLPVTSVCNMRCVFCSNRYNPPGVEAVFTGPRALEEIVASLAQLAGADRIVIGESATRICEGEPLTHPHILEILRRVRERFPRKPVRLTTNGSLITREIAGELTALGVEVTVSLNSCSPAVRRKVMGDVEPGRSLDGVRYLGEAGVRFHGSIVAIPAVAGHDDIAGTLCFLESAGALTCRVFIPGYTRHGPVDTLFTSRDGLEGVIANLYARGLEMPVTVEPPVLRDLTPEVEGVMRGSPAARAGIRRGDVIHSVNGVQCRSRHEAFRLLSEAENPVVELRGLTLTLVKRRGAAPGVVMSSDIDFERVDEALGLAARRCAAPVFVTSSLASGVVKAAMAAAGRRERAWAAERLCVAPNEFFGGNIGCAGLLTVSDVVEALERFKVRAGAFDLVVAPAAPFDERGRDLVGRSFTEIEDVHGVPVVLV